MQVIEDTPARLVIEDRPWVLGGILAVCILLSLALGMALWTTTAWATLGFGLTAAFLGGIFVIFVRRILVILDRPAKSVVIRTRSLFGTDEHVLSLSVVTGAEVETSRSTSTDTDGSRSVSITYRPILSTVSGPVPLTPFHSAGDGSRIIAEAINRWLDQP